MSSRRLKVAFIGSVSFAGQMSALAGQLQTLGAEVKFPQPDPRVQGNDPHSLAAVLEQNQLNQQRLAWADVVVIMNEPKHGQPEYIGPNSLIDTGVAFALGKPIYTRYPVGFDRPYGPEINALVAGTVGSDPAAWLGNLKFDMEVQTPTDGYWAITNILTDQLASAELPVNKRPDKAAEKGAEIPAKSSVANPQGGVKDPNVVQQ